MLKIGAFAGLAAMTVQPVRVDPKLYAQLIESFGLSVHHLILDMFQVDILFASGFRRGEFGFAPGVRIERRVDPRDGPSVAWHSRSWYVALRGVDGDEPVARRPAISNMPWGRTTRK